MRRDILDELPGGVPEGVGNCIEIGISRISPPPGIIGDSSVGFAERDQRIEAERKIIELSDIIINFLLLTFEFGRGYFADSPAPPFIIQGVRQLAVPCQSVMIY